MNFVCFIQFFDIAKKRLCFTSLWSGHSANDRTGSGWSGAAE